jgi:hypothetical protein
LLLGAIALVALGAPRTSAAEVAPAPPAPYSLPWQLRPAGVANVARADTTVARYQNPASGDAGSTVAATFLFAYKVTPTLAPLVRAAVVWNDSPGPATGGAAVLSSPLLGLTYGRTLSSAPAWRYAALAAVAIPVGMGGDQPAAKDAKAAAIAAGILARSGLDNALFAVNYFTPLFGLDVAYVAGALTVQAEVTLLQLFRARNADVPSAADATRTNATAGLHVGYFLLPILSVGTELRHQRWLSTPKLVAASPAARDTTTIAVGARLHLHVRDKVWLRPGLSYGFAVDDPLAASHYHLFQIDLPLAF